MRKKSPGVFAFACMCVCAFLCSCGGAQPKFTMISGDGIEECTRAHLGRLDPVQVVFSAELPAEMTEAGALKQVLRIFPPVKGTVAKTDSHTLRFTPSEPYKSGAVYTVAVDTGLVSGGKAGTAGFVYRITARDSEYVFSPEGLTAEKGDSYETFSFSGTITTDIAHNADIFGKMLTVSLNGKKLPVRWLETGDGDLLHNRTFIVEQITRREKQQILTVKVDGSPVGAQGREERQWLIPAKDTFEVLAIETAEPSCFTVRFSDRLDAAQDIRGFVRSKAVQAENVRYDIDGSVLRLYAGRDWKQGEDIEILQGIRSESGKVLRIPVAATRSSYWEKPAVSFAARGVLLPANNGVTLAVDTLNLSGLIVQVYQIQSTNMMQFLQVNELDGSRELERVAAPIWTKTFDFPWSDSLQNVKVRRGLDLSELVKKFPGGMYQIRVTFRKRHIQYQCQSNHTFSNMVFPPDEIPFNAVRPGSDEDSSWDYYDSPYRDYYSYRNDPCHPAFFMDYYNSGITGKKNVLVTNLGVMAKYAADGTLAVSVADIASTAAVSGADVRLYTYAQKELAAAKTDASGFALFKLPAEKTETTLGKAGSNTLPYFVSVSRQNQITVMRIDKGTALSTSHFEVDGENVFTGMKGYIYGERGVWRPGDTMYLTFILQNSVRDTEKKLPENFPVTFELQNPRGLVTQTAVLNKPENGFYRINAQTSEEDPTGTWTARFTAGGKSWTKALKVETVIPNRLFVQLQPERNTLLPGRNNFTLSGSWLHGAKAPGLKADVSMALYQAETNFTGFGDYTFTNPQNSVSYRRETVWEGELGSDSKTEFVIAVYPENNLPGKLKAQMMTRIFENEGAFSSEQTTIDYSPYERYVGLKMPKGDAARNMLLTDTDHQAELLVVDGDGKPVQPQTVLSMSLYKLEWRWWWEKDAYQNVSEYSSGRSHKLISSGDARTTNGRATWKFRVNYPDWGRYLLVARDEKGGHSAAAVVYIDWPGWAGRSQEGESGSSSMVPLVTDKAKYAPGETAVISFSAGKDSRALVTVEKSGRILRQDWVESPSAGTASYKLNITADMAPNAYVHVTLLQKHLQTANDLPIRLYGITPVAVEAEETRLYPVIQMPPEFAPAEKAAVTVSERNGKPMTFTLAIVDEGLLGITAFKTQNPWNEFFRKEASVLSSWDVYNYVMNAFSGKLETLLTIGGGDGGDLRGGEKANNRFTPVVRYFGPYTIQGKESKTVEFEMPLYIGAVRAMVVAGGGSAYGVAEQSAPVKAALMTQTAIPRTIGVNEEITVPITVFSDNTEQKLLILTVSAQGSLQVMQNGSPSSVQKLTLPISSATENTVSFKLRAVSAGTGTISVTSAFAGERNGKTFAENLQLEAQSRGTPVKYASSESVPRNGSRELRIVMGQTEGAKKLRIEISPQPVIDLESRLSYLLAYPHGCIEQITSGGFPQLFLERMTVPDRQRTETIRKNVQSVIDRYPLYQTTSGGFAYWSGGSQPDSWGTNYAGHFMLQAKKTGYAIPDTLFAPWLVYQKKQAADWDSNSRDDERTQAYRLYTLALAGSADMGSMNRLRSRGNLGLVSSWYLAAGYYLAGQRAEAESLTRALGLNPESYREYGNTFGSGLRDSAIILDCLNTMENTQKIPPLIKRIAETLGSDKWLSTQEAAYSLLALSPHYSSGIQEGSGYSFELNGKTWEGTLQKTLETISLPDTEAETVSTRFKNTGKQPLYVKLVADGVLPPGKETRVNKGLSMEVDYCDKNDGRIYPDALRLGDTVRINVRVNNLSGENLQNVALTIPTASGWEILNMRLGRESDSYSQSGESEYTYRDIRDNAVYTYFDINKGSTRTYQVEAVVINSGRYYLPAVKAEVMYDDEKIAVFPGAPLTIPEK